MTWRVKYSTGQLKQSFWMNTAVLYSGAHTWSRACLRTFNDWLRQIQSPLKSHSTWVVEVQLDSRVYKDLERTVVKRFSFQHRYRLGAYNFVKNECSLRISTTVT